MASRPKLVKTCMGEITLAVPQVRQGGFYPIALEKGLRSEIALTISLAEQNAGMDQPRQSIRLDVDADIRSMFNAPARKTAEELLQSAIHEYTVSAPRLSAWLEDNLSGGAVFEFSLEHRITIRTTKSWRGLTKGFSDEHEW